MPNYQVIYQVRKVGAIGIFWSLACDIQANTPKEAADKAFEDLHAKGYETCACRVYAVFKDGFRYCGTGIAFN